MTESAVDSTRLEDLCQKHDIVFLGLFGSFARGDFTPGSDVDLLVRFSKAKSLLQLVRIEREMAERLGRPVDLVTEAALSPYLKERILSAVKSIYASSSSATASR